MNWLHDLLLDMIRAYRGYIGSTLSEAPDRWREYRRASVAVMLRVRGMRKHYVARAQAAEERARRAEQRETEARGCLDVVYAALSGEPVSDVMHRSPAVRAAAEARVNARRAEQALRTLATLVRTRNGDKPLSDEERAALDLAAAPETT